MIRAVIFDLDGVLVSTDELHFRAWKRLADEEGIPFTRRDNDRLRGVSRMASLEIILERAPRAYTAEEKQRLADRKNAGYRALLRGLTPADRLPGVDELLAQLRRRGVRLAVASGSRNAGAILDAVDLRSAFDAVVTGEDIAKGKPDPELFLTAAARVGVPPQECLVVEDAVSGVEAAHRGGMAAVGIGPADRFPPGVRVLPALAGVDADELLAPAATGPATPAPS